jgi:RNA polymerase sigma factor (sigma-70 family)
MAHPPGHTHAMIGRTDFERRALPHMDAAHNLAFHLLQSRSDAEDAVQDSYIRAYRAFHQLQGADIKPWLLTIVRNVCYRRLQQGRHGRNIISLDDAVGTRGAIAEAELASTMRSPEQMAIDASDRTLLASAIAALAPVFREVIVLREIEELSYREIAVVIGAPVGTVMSRLSRARAELRALLTTDTKRTGKDAM